ncbi:MAG: heme-degrading monooxygenase HmoA [Kiritimatiellia bacterium]|jgi:heme-degrading monooxygenase HmoA
MIYRSQILICHEAKRTQMLQALGHALVNKPPGMAQMTFAADVAEENTIVVYQAWESKEAFEGFQRALPAEKAAFFKTLVASKTECWHAEWLQLSA